MKSRIGEEFSLVPKEDPNYKVKANGYLPFKQATKLVSFCMASRVEYQVYLTPNFDEGKATFSSYVLNHDLGDRNWSSANPELKTMKDEDWVNWKLDTKPANEKKVEEVESHSAPIAENVIIPQ